MRVRIVGTVLVMACCVAAALVSRQGYVMAADTKLTPQDYMEIEQLYAKYYHTIDSGDAEGWASVFTTDGAFNTSKGQEALKAFITNGTAKGTTLRHWQSNLLLTPTPEGVRAKVYVIQFDIKARPVAASSYSRYDDLIVKSGGKWLFKEKMRSTDTTIGNRGAGAGPSAAQSPQPGGRQ